ncbi:MAG: insulinase family protein, partial [Methylobacterium sp.]
MHLFRKATPTLFPLRPGSPYGGSAGRGEAAPFGRSEAGGPEVTAFTLD